jgi:hypothetical protein
LKLVTIARRARTLVARGATIDAALEAVLARDVSRRKQYPLSLEYPSADALILARCHRAAEQRSEASALDVLDAVIAGEGELSPSSPLAQVADAREFAPVGQAL